MRTLLWFLIVSVLGVGAFVAEPFYWWLTTDKIIFDNPPNDWTVYHTRGWYRVEPGTHERHGRFVGYYADSGTKWIEQDYREGVLIRHTCWRPDGSVLSQQRSPDDDRVVDVETFKVHPPWWWGVGDEYGPSDPRWKPLRSR